MGKKGYYSLVHLYLLDQHISAIGIKSATSSHGVVSEFAYLHVEAAYALANPQDVS